MSQTLQYLLEVTLCWAVFYAIFFAFLRQVTFFSVNRWYLLSTLLLGIFIPLLRHVEIDLHQEQISQALPLVMMVGEMPAQMAISVEEATIDWQQYIYWALGGVYFIGVSFFAYRLLRSLYKIYQLKSMARVEIADQAILLHTDQPHLPFSFLHYIFISDQVALSEEYDDILRHEIEHVRSHHTINVLLIELIQILFWFNPFIYLYKTAIRQTHEYLADAAVLQSTNRKTYGTMLLKQSLSGLEIALTHRFFHSHIKKRINMMYQKQSGRSAWINYSFALIGVFTMGLLFACQQNEEVEIIDSSFIKGQILDEVVLTAFGRSRIKTEMSPTTLDPINNATWLEVTSEVNTGTAIQRVPLFPGCEELGESYLSQKECANNKLNHYLYTNLIYPKEARKAGIEGRTLVQFVIQKDGTIGRTHLVKDIGGGCGEAALAVINNMNDDGIRWTPGVDAGQQVDVLYTLPVIYKLEG